MFHTMQRLACVTAVLTLASCAAPRVAAPPAAQLQRLEIVSRAPAFGGARFGDTGAYETIVAVAHMRIDARDPANARIADIGLAAARDGWIDYQTDVVIARPADAAKASRVLLVDLPNRGGKLFPVMANEGSDSLEAGADTGTGYLMRRGHTLVWIGWQGDIPLQRDGKRTGTSFPLIQDHGKPLTGPSAEEAVFDNVKPTGTMNLAYPAASMAQAAALLTVRANNASAQQVVPPASWRYTGPAQVEITRPAGYDAGAIYRFEYVARDPRLMGLGMAALRDVTSYLKHEAHDAAGQPNPVADIAPEVAVAVGVSQSGRFLRDLIWQGFNADPHGGKVFDGAMPLIAGSRKSFVNLRFSQPGRYSTQHIDHITYGDQFPFSYGVTTDPVSGRTDGIFARCAASRTCPQLMHVDSSLEFWQARASLVVTDGAGHDIALPDNVRAYLLSSTQHMAARTPTVGICKVQNNPARQGPAVRALLERLVEWSREGIAPPPSRYPRLAEHMLVVPQRDAVGFPDLHAIGIDYPEVINGLSVVDYSTLPGTVIGARSYQVLVPMADADGHDIAGIRLPDVAVPLATYAGWNLRRHGFAENQLCGLNGLSVPLPASARAGDPRRAIGQRYSSRLEYAKAVALSARELRDQGLLLDDDANQFIERAKAETRVAP